MGPGYFPFEFLFVITAYSLHQAPLLVLNHYLGFFGLVKVFQFSNNFCGFLYIFGLFSPLQNSIFLFYTVTLLTLYYNSILTIGFYENKTKMLQKPVYFGAVFLTDFQH